MNEDGCSSFIIYFIYKFDDLSVECRGEKTPGTNSGGDPLGGKFEGSDYRLSRFGPQRTWVFPFGSCNRVGCRARRLESVGSGVWELKEQDERKWYRVIYLARIDNVIYVLHCFEKAGSKAR